MNFRFLNIPVYIHPTFWIFLLFFTNVYRNPSIESLILGGVMFFSLLVHEFGHALTAAYFGARPSITLEAFGGRAEYNPTGITLKQRFLITLNGPLFESILILLSYSLLKSGNFEAHPHIQYLLQVTMRLNILWCLLNLVPVMPLDGGQLLRYLLERKFGYKGYRASIIIGLISIVVMTPYLFSQGYSFFGLLLLFMGLENYQALQREERASGKSSQLNQYLESVEAINKNELDKAKLLLKKLLKSRDPKVKHLAVESMAKIHYKENETEKSYDLLINADPQLLKEGKTLLCKLAFERKNYELVSQYALDIYASDPTFEIALLNSQAFAHLKDPDLAGGWLETAAQFGDEYRERVKEKLSDPAYDAVRDAEIFKEHTNIVLQQSNK